MKKVKKMNGGDGEDGNGGGNNMINWDMNKMSLYYATVLVGYFGTKIFMGFYKIYSTKVPSRELDDFNTIIVLTLLTYIFTGMNNRNVLGKNTKTKALHQTRRGRAKTYHKLIPLLLQGMIDTQDKALHVPFHRVGAKGHLAIERSTP